MEKAIPRPEHPRPDKYRENWLCLNGEWDFAFDETGLPSLVVAVAYTSQEQIVPAEFAAASKAVVEFVLAISVPFLLTTYSTAPVTADQLRLVPEADVTALKDEGASRHSAYFISL